MIITIDGPAGVGKSSAARALADRLGFRFLDTGALYRAVTLAAHRRGVDWHRPEQLVEVADSVAVELQGDRVLLDGEDVSQQIRTLEITTLTKYAADNVEVRHRLSQWQRRIADSLDYVTEGRDQASEVFPHAECKFYLDASEKVRAERRYRDLLARGEKADLEDVLQKQQARDARDMGRGVGGLTKTPDSIVVDTDSLGPVEVVDVLEKMARERMRR